MKKNKAHVKGEVHSKLATPLTLMDPHHSLSHARGTFLQFLVSSVGLPGELHVLLSLLLAHLTQHVCKLVKLLVPCIEHCETLLHDLYGQGGLTLS